MADERTLPFVFLHSLFSPFLFRYSHASKSHLSLHHPPNKQTSLLLHLLTFWLSATGAFYSVEILIFNLFFRKCKRTAFYVSKQRADFKWLVVDLKSVNSCKKLYYVGFALGSGRLKDCYMTTDFVLKLMKRSISSTSITHVWCSSASAVRSFLWQFVEVQDKF